MPDLQNTFISIDPVTGQLHFVFPGGVEIPANEDPGAAILNLPSADNAVRYRAASIDQVVAFLYAYYALNQRAIILETFREIAGVATDSLVTILRALDNDPFAVDTETAQIQLLASRATSVSQIDISAGHMNRLLLGDAGSDFFPDAGMSGPTAGATYGGVGTIYNTLNIEAQGTMILLQFSGHVQHNGVAGTLYTLGVEFRQDGISLGRFAVVNDNTVGRFHPISGVQLVTGLTRGQVYTFDARIASITATPALAMLDHRLIAVTLPGTG